MKLRTDWESKYHNLVERQKEVVTGAIAMCKAWELNVKETVAENDKIRKERDAAVADLYKAKNCINCKFYDEGSNTSLDCLKNIGGEFRCQYEWHGVQPERKE